MWKHKLCHKIYETETENRLVVAKGEGGWGFADADGYI